MNSLFDELNDLGHAGPGLQEPASARTRFIVLTMTLAVTAAALIALVTL